MMSRPASPEAVKLIVICSLFLIIALVAFGLRLWSRKLKQRPFDASDWLVLASTIVVTILSLIIFAGAVIGGAGYHQSDIASASNGGPSSLNNAAKIVFVAEMLWLTSNALTKLSTLAFYSTIFRVSRFRYAVWTLMGLTTTMFIAFVIKDFLICTPVERNWSFDDPNNYCGVTPSGTLATGIGITIMDAIIVFAPMTMLFKLQMPTTKKLFICGIFSIGLVVCIISALRLVAVLRLDHNDLTYTIIDLGIFTLLEPLLGITACCLPTLHPVIIRLSSSTTSFFDWTRRTSRSRKASGSAKRSHGTGGSTTLRGTRNSKPHNLNETKNFNRLYDHLYPVTTTTVTEATVAGPGDDALDPEHAYSLSNLQPWLRDRGGKGAISVTKEFKVDSVHLERGPFDKPLPSVPEDVKDRGVDGNGERHLDVEMGFEDGFLVSGQRSRESRFVVSGQRSRDEMVKTPDEGAEPVSPLSMEAPRWV